MRLSCIAFTERGLAAAHRVERALSAAPTSGARAAWDVFVSRGFGEGKVPLASWTESAWGSSDALLFVGAAGIAVRAVAPHIRSKASDPAVVVLDEGARFSVALLSGHLGGANELAREIAAATGAEAVVTTATDGRGMWAADAWARREGLLVANPAAIKRVSARLLSGGRVALYADVPIAGRAPEGIDLAPCAAKADVVVSPFACAGKAACANGAAEGPLRLVPRCIACGIGCRRGIAREAIEEAFGLACAKAGIAPEAVSSVASIDVKAREAGLVAFCEAHALPFLTYPASVLARVTGSVSPSPFVRDAVGVDNVCERAALATGGALVLPKFAHQGVTVAFAQVTGDISFEEGIS